MSGKSVRPSPNAKIAGLKLNVEEGFVLSRIDRRRSVREIAELAGLPEERVTAIVDRLARQGAVDYIAPDEVPSRASLPQPDQSGSYTYAALNEPIADANADESTRDLYEPRDDSESREEVVDLFNLDAIPLADDALLRAPADPIADPNADLNADPISHPLADFGRVSEALTQEALPDDDDLPPEAPPSVPRDAETLPELEELGPVDDDEGPPLIEEGDTTASDSPEEIAEDDQAKVDEKNVRKIYETKFHKLDPNVRIALAGQASGLDLLALCLDQDPKVIAAVMANTGFVLAHGRLVAFHHRTGIGLDMLTGRVEFVRDGLVFRRLIRNTGLQAGTLRRILQPKRLIEIYKVTLDRDVPDLARTNSRGLLRTKFTSQAQPEERAEIILHTEARVLQQLSGCTIDARTTSILCGRQTFSALFIQNVARFPAAPPNLLAHLAKIPFVRRNPGLRKILMQHPNMPGDVKRSM